VAIIINMIVMSIRICCLLLPPLLLSPPMLQICEKPCDAVPRSMAELFAENHTLILSEISYV
jgi:hypothetical protein